LELKTIPVLILAPTRKFIPNLHFQALTILYSSVGALAELFDVSCLYGTKFFSGITSDAFALWHAAPPSISAPSVVEFLHTFKNPAVLGEHYFIVNPVTGTGTSPKWDFTSHAFSGNPDAFMVGAKVSSLAAPTGPSDVDWLQLSNVAGSLADEIYRTDTRGGQPPASVICSHLWFEMVVLISFLSVFLDRTPLQ